MNADGITLGYGFLRDGCTVMANNIGGLLLMAGEPITIVNVLEIVKSLPVNADQLLDESWRKGKCSKLMERACGEKLDADDDMLRRELIEYFTSYIPTRSYVALDMLRSAFMGVLSIPFESGTEPVTDELAVVRDELKISSGVTTTPEAT